MNTEVIEFIGQIIPASSGNGAASSSATAASAAASGGADSKLPAAAAIAPDHATAAAAAVEDPDFDEDLELMSRGIRPVRAFPARTIRLRDCTDPTRIVRILSHCLIPDRSHALWHLQYKLCVNSDPKTRTKFTHSVVAGPAYLPADEHRDVNAYFRTHTRFADTPCVTALLALSEFRSRLSRTKDLFVVLRALASAHPCAAEGLKLLEPHLESRLLAYPEIAKFAPLFGPKSMPRIMLRSTRAQLSTLNELLSAANTRQWLTFPPVVAARCDGLYIDAPLAQVDGWLTPLPDSDPMRIAQTLCAEFKTFLRKDGHTYATNDECTRIIPRVTAPRTSASALSSAWEWLIAHRVVVRECDRTYLPDSWRDEWAIADALTTLRARTVTVASSTSSHAAALGPPKDKSGYDTDCVGMNHEQKDALAHIVSQPLTILTGGGGCGKTKVATAAACYFDEPVASGSSDVKLPSVESQVQARAVPHNDGTGEDDGDAELQRKRKKTSPSESLFAPMKGRAVLLTAPTGRAAQLLKSRAGKRPAYTLHSVLFSYYNWRLACDEQQKESKSAAQPEWPLAGVEFWVIDECSLVSVSLFAAVLGILMKHTRLNRILILGDPSQLPSVAPGRLLIDLIGAWKPAGCWRQLEKNHRSSSESIREMANHIKACRPDALRFDESRFVLCEGKTQTRDALLVSLLGANASNWAETHQIITLRNEDCVWANEICAAHFSALLQPKTFTVRDKICARKNYIAIDELTHEPVYFANGDLFLVERIYSVERELSDGKDLMEHRSTSEFKSAKTRFHLVVLRDPQPPPGRDRVLHVQYHTLQRCRATHGWCRTIHTFQGSEQKNVLYLLSQNSSQHEHSGHVYTAITRAQERVSIVGSRFALAAAVKRAQPERNSSLVSRFVAVATERKINFHPPSLRPFPSLSAAGVTLAATTARTVPTPTSASSSSSAAAAPLSVESTASKVVAAAASGPRVSFRINSEYVYRPSELNGYAYRHDVGTPPAAISPQMLPPYLHGEFRPLNAQSYVVVLRSGGGAVLGVNFRLRKVSAKRTEYGYLSATDLPASYLAGIRLWKGGNPSPPYNPPAGAEPPLSIPSSSQPAEKKQRLNATATVAPVTTSVSALSPDAMLHCQASAAAATPAAATTTPSSSAKRKHDGS